MDRKWSKKDKNNNTTKYMESRYNKKFTLVNNDFRCQIIPYRSIQQTMNHYTHTT